MPGTNLALNKTASADSTQTGNGTANGNDGNTITRWCATDGNVNHWWMVDLGASYNLNGSQVMWESSGAYKYKIETSADNATWSTKVDKTGNTTAAQMMTDNFAAAARYVRITVTGLPSGYWASFYEFSVFGIANVPTPTPTATPIPTLAPTPTITPTPTPQSLLGDLNGDGSVDATDYALMKMYLLGSTYLPPWLQLCFQLHC